MSECLNYSNLTKQNSLVKEIGNGVGGRGRLFNNGTHCGMMKHGSKHEWQVAGYLFCTNCLQTLYLKSKESCIQKGFVGRSTFILGLMMLVLLLSF